MQRRASGVDIANAVRERLGIDVLEQVAGRSRRDRREDLRVVREARQHEHADPGRDLEQAADRPDPVALGHDQVEEDHIGRRRCGDADRLVGARGLADHLDAVLKTQERAQPFANDRVVVDDEEPDRRVHAVTSIGTLTVTVVPAPGRVRMSRRRADLICAFAHGRETHPAPRARQRLDIEARAVVVDAQRHRLRPRPQGHAHRRAGRMTHRVVERLLGDAQQRVLGLERETDALGRVDDDARAAGAQRLGVVGERRGEPVTLEALGTECVHEAAQLLQRRRGALLEPEDRGACLLVAGGERRRAWRRAPG